jgi:hypothetical protein
MRRKVEEAFAAGDRSRATAAMAEAELNSRRAKRHRASQFGAEKSVSALAPDCETGKEINFLAPAPNAIRIVDCNQSVALLSRGFGIFLSVIVMRLCAQRRRRFLFAPVSRSDGYPVSARRRIHAQ